MLGNKNKKPNIDQELATKVNQDLLVRNMPKFNRTIGAAYSVPATKENTQSNLLADVGRAKHNFKMVGGIIIAGGLIFIGALVYLSYIYIIKPQTKNTTPVVATVVPKTNTASSTTETEATTSTITVATTSTIVEATSSAPELATSSASSTMNEELTGKQNTNLPPLVDSDSDGLNDEEEVVFGTNPQLADSNNNSYPDLTEINNNYNPAGSGKMVDNANFTKYTNNTIGYSTIYPKTWTVRSLNDESTITFTAPDDSIIQISVQDNTDKQSILGWYSNSFSEATVTYDKLKTTDNWDGVMGDDGLNFYLTDKKHKNIYVISYIPAVDGRLVYPNVFKVMVNLFSIK